MLVYIVFISPLAILQYIHVFSDIPAAVRQKTVRLYRDGTAFGCGVIQIHGVYLPGVGFRAARKASAERLRIRRSGKPTSFARA